jgi:hypothetical protein
MHGADLILTLTGGLAAARVFGYITQRLGLSPIAGYLIGGTIVGPHTPGFVADPHLAEQLAEVGVILLMFGVGLQFHIEELLAVRRVALPGAVLRHARPRSRTALPRRHQHHRRRRDRVDRPQSVAVRHRFVIRERQKATELTIDNARP